MYMYISLCLCYILKLGHCHILDSLVSFSFTQDMKMFIFLLVFCYILKLGHCHILDNLVSFYIYTEPEHVHLGVAPGQAGGTGVVRWIWLRPGSLPGFCLYQACAQPGRQRVRGDGDGPPQAGGNRWAMRVWSAEPVAARGGLTAYRHSGQRYGMCNMPVVFAAIRIRRMSN